MENGGNIATVYVTFKEQKYQIVNIKYKNIKLYKKKEKVASWHS